jgi:hypothetical protein
LLHLPSLASASTLSGFPKYVAAGPIVDTVTTAHQTFQINQRASQTLQVLFKPLAHRKTPVSIGLSQSFGIF